MKMRSIGFHYIKTEEKKDKKIHQNNIERKLVENFEQIFHHKF